LLAAGLTVTHFSTHVVWYGALVVGFIEIVRGLHALVRHRAGRGNY
jgi:hypothetical protein